MSKFKSLDAYLPKENTGYEILPLKFERLGGDVFVSNLVGEFKFLSEKDFQDFTAYNINPISELYSDLQSKHLLIERGSSISLELLALKLRTKLKRLSSFTALHLFVVSLRCEHSCPYCQVSRQSDNKVAFDMTQEIADKALDLTFQSPSSAIKIEFQGGEPLLNFPIIKYIVQSALEINKAKKKNLAFVIATNLAVISDEMLEFCKHNQK